MGDFKNRPMYHSHFEITDKRASRESFAYNVELLSALGAGNEALPHGTNPGVNSDCSSGVRSGDKPPLVIRREGIADKNSPI